MSGLISAAVIGTVGAGAMANQAEITGRGALADQQAMQQEGLSQEQQMFDKSLAIMEPYREAGYGGLAGLQGLTTPQGRADSLNQYYAGPEYQAQQQQATSNALRGASAQGGLRGGSTYSALENIAPQLGQNYLANQQNQFTGLANMGMGAASQGAGGYQQLGNSAMNMYNQMGTNTANQQIAAANSQNQAIGQGIQGIGSAFGNYFNPQGTI